LTLIIVGVGWFAAQRLTLPLRKLSSDVAILTDDLRHRKRSLLLFVIAGLLLGVILFYGSDAIIRRIIQPSMSLSQLNLQSVNKTDYRPWEDRAFPSPTPNS
jgi:hypothetical protein